MWIGASVVVAVLAASQALWLKYLIINFPSMSGTAFITTSRIVSMVALGVITLFTYILSPETQDSIGNTFANMFRSGLYKHAVGIGIVMAVAPLVFVYAATHAPRAGFVQAIGTISVPLVLVGGMIFLGNGQSRVGWAVWVGSGLMVIGSLFIALGQGF
jgi:hypothetical protein